jgi:hypothetical protein
VETNAASTVSKAERSIAWTAPLEADEQVLRRNSLAWGEGFR